ncbi:MAG: exopolysaccharide biosynthesis protein [Verrucomicrobia bacterium]|nr:exopolysaccharide biosynthesis protein [Verrucomicrobiota bacterium]
MTEPSPRRLSQEIAALLAEGRSLSIGEIESILQSRGVALLIMLLSAPFLIPSVPGLSTPFGAAIILMGACLACGRKPWLPQFVLRRELSLEMLRKILGVLIQLLQCMERLTQPRIEFLQSGPGMSNLIGLGIASGGIFLFLPIMVPVMNTLPTLSILFLTAGMMERDGLFVILGYFFGLAAWVYFGAWLLLGKAGFDCLHGMF